MVVAIYLSGHKFPSYYTGHTEKCPHSNERLLTHCHIHLHFPYSQKLIYGAEFSISGSECHQGERLVEAKQNLVNGMHPLKERGRGRNAGGVATQTLGEMGKGENKRVIEFIDSVISSEYTNRANMKDWYTSFNRKWCCADTVMVVFQSCELSNCISQAIFYHKSQQQVGVKSKIIMYLYQDEKCNPHSIWKKECLNTPLDC